MEATVGASPWWFIPQYFGKGAMLSQESYCRLPTAAELGAHVHLALANGARGLIGFAVAMPINVMLIDWQNSATRARDGSRPACACTQLAKAIAANGELLLRHQAAGAFATASDTEVAVVARFDPTLRETCLYAINKNTTEPKHNVRLAIEGLQIATAADAYDEVYGGSVAAVGGGIDADFARGQGRLICLGAMGSPSS